MAVKVKENTITVTEEINEKLLATVRDLGDVQNREITLDISSIAYVSSSGIASVAAAGSKIKEKGGTLKVLIHAKAEKIFRITEMDRILVLEVKA